MLRIQQKDSANIRLNLFQAAGIDVTIQLLFTYAAMYAD